MALFVWFPSGVDRPDMRIARALRGGPVFDLLAVNPMLLFGMKTYTAGPTGVHVPNNGRPGIVFAPLGTLVDILNEKPQMLDELAESKSKLIVDVHFPLPSPARMNAIQDVPEGGDRDEQLDQQVRDMWSDPVRVEQAYEVLRTADAITWGPHGFFDLGRIGPLPVGGPLPDVKTAEDSVLFYRRIVELVWALSAGPVLKGWQRRWSKFALRHLFLRHTVKHIRDMVTIEETP